MNLSPSDSNGGSQVDVVVQLEEMPARLVERVGEPIVVIQITRVADPLLAREPLCREDMRGPGSGARAVLLGLERVPPEAVAEHADAAQLRGGIPVGGEERVVERRLAVGHVEERGLLRAAAAPVVEARDGEAERRGGRALDGGEDGVEEVRGGGLREEVAAEEGGERELEARGGGGLEAADAEEGEAGGGEEAEAAAERRGLEEEAAVEAGGGDAGDGGVGARHEAGDAGGVEGGIGGGPGDWDHGERRRGVGLGGGAWVAAAEAAAEVSAIPNAKVAQPSAVVLAERNLLGSDASLSVHAGERLGRRIATDAITTPVVNTSAYWFNNSQELIDFKEGRHASFEYGRYGNPTTEALEKKMSALERAESTVFVASGMYAAVAMLSALVPAGGHIVTTTDCYRKTRIYMETELPKRGISMTVIRPADMDALQNALDNNNVSLFFTETPTNPFLRCIDVEHVSNMCRSKGALLCIDSTFASPINQKALTLGADLVIHSATKYIAGHNDVIGGCVSGRDELVSKVRTYHHVVGGVLNPNAAYLILRGMKTLHLRVQCQNNTALRMAQFLEEHPKIARVYYPGLPSHPEHHIAKSQMTGFGGVVSFEVAGDFDGTRRFIDSVKIPYHAPSFGGCESIIDQPAIMSYWDSKEQRDIYGIKDNLIRFSIGVEDFEDLKNDLVQALEKI